MIDRQAVYAEIEPVVGWMTESYIHRTLFPEVPEGWNQLLRIHDYLMRDGKVWYDKNYRDADAIIVRLASNELSESLAA